MPPPCPRCGGRRTALHPTLGYLRCSDCLNGVDAFGARAGCVLVLIAAVIVGLVAVGVWLGVR